MKNLKLYHVESHKIAIKYWLHKIYVDSLIEMREVEQLFKIRYITHWNNNDEFSTYIHIDNARNYHHEVVIIYKEEE